MEGKEKRDHTVGTTVAAILYCFALFGLQQFLGMISFSIKSQGEINEINAHLDSSNYRY